jgi:hypothetical protein
MAAPAATTRTAIRNTPKRFESFIQDSFRAQALRDVSSNLTLTVMRPNAKSKRCCLECL